MDVFMKRKTLLTWLAFVLVAVFALTACGNSDTTNTNSASSTKNSTEPTASTESSNVFADEKAEVGEGTITVLTNITEGDRLDKLDEWAKQFDDLYPGQQTVKFESIADYENQVKIRLSSTDYGDVLLIPNTVEVKNLGEYFLPLGTYDELSKKYLAIDDRTFNNSVYGIPVSIQFTGIFYNKDVFKQAGITEIPHTMDNFLDALQKIKDTTKAVPLYTAYADQWTLNQWEANTLTAAKDAEYPYIKQAHDRNNFLPGSPNYILYNLMYEAAHRKLIEDDPATATFDEAKRLLAKGDAATYVASSWAIGQFQQAAEGNPEVIGYMPYPVEKNDDPQIVRLGRDYVNGVSVHSKHQDIALAWVKFFTETPYATELSSSISPIQGDQLQMPEIAKAWNDMGVKFAPSTPAAGDDQGLLDSIDKESEVGLLDAAFKQRIIDAAIGNRKESYDDIMKDLNTRWVEAMDKLDVK
jgi:raffinose/stachyose/melibiose transport system substrate-binding protein